MPKFFLYEVLKQRGMLPFEKAAAATGLAVSTIHKLCGGSDQKRPIQRIDLDTLGILCDRLGLRVDELLVHESTLMHELRQKCRALKVVVGARSTQACTPKTRSLMPRPLIDPNDMQAVSIMERAFVHAMAGKQVEFKTEFVRNCGRTLTDAQQQSLFRPDTLVVTIGSPISNSLTGPILRWLAQRCGKEGFQSNVRMCSFIDSELQREAGDSLDVLIDSATEANGVFTPTLGIYFGKKLRLKVTPRTELHKMGPHTDAAIIFYCCDPLWIGICGCGGIGTRGAAQYIEEKGFSAFCQDDSTPKGEPSCLVVRVDHEKPTDSIEDDREPKRVVELDRISRVFSKEAVL